MLVESIKEAVTEAPEEEERGDQGDGPDGLARGQLGGPGDATLGGLERPILEELLDTHVERLISERRRIVRR